MQSILSLANSLSVDIVYKLRIVIASGESSSIRYIQHREVRENTRSSPRSKCFHQNSVPDTRFEAEVPPSHIRSSMDVFWRSPRTGTKCITSFAESPSCLTILKSDKRETVNVAAKNDNTSQSDR